MRLFACVLVGTAWFALAPGAAQEAPLPDLQAFLAEARKHLETDSSLQSSYAYEETRRERKLDGRGRVTDESIKVFESFPGFPGEPRWERLLSENGRAVPRERLESQDRDRQRRAQEYASRMARAPEREHANQVREWQEYQREVSERVDDVFRVFDIRMLGRESIGGHSTVLLALTPRPDARPRTREGGQMRRFSARAWISEADHQLVRLEAEAIENLSWGWGVLARLHKGSRLTFERRKVNGEVWLPASASYEGSARVGLLVRLRRSGSSEYANYRKFTVDTSTDVVPPAE